MIEYKNEIVKQQSSRENHLNNFFQNDLLKQKAHLLRPFFSSNKAATRKNADVNDIDRFLTINSLIIEKNDTNRSRNNVQAFKQLPPVIEKSYEKEFLLLAHTNSLLEQMSQCYNSSFLSKIQQKIRPQYLEEPWARLSMVMGLCKTQHVSSEFKCMNKIKYPISKVKLSDKKGKRSYQMYVYLSATTHKLPKHIFTLPQKNCGQLDCDFENNLHHKYYTHPKSGIFYGLYDGAASDEENKDSRPFYGPKLNVTMGKAPFDRFTSNKESESPWHQALVKMTGTGPVTPTEKKRRENNIPDLVHGAPPRSATNILKGLKLKSQKEVTLEKRMAAAENYRREINERKNKKINAINAWQVELEIRESAAKYKSRKLLKPAKVDQRFPNSWSRYSSHDRAERLTRSLSLEQIKVRDFANLGYKNNEIVWCLAHDANGHKTELEEISEKTKFKQRIENSAVVFLYKLKVRHVQKQAEGARGRRGSLSVAGEMEFPELELLPISLMTEIEIEREVQEEERQQAERELKKMRKIMMEKVMKEREIEENLLQAEGHVRRHESFSEVLHYSDVVDIIADVVVDSVVVMETVPTSSHNILSSGGNPDLFFSKEQEN